MRRRATRRYCAEHGGAGVHQHALACVKANVNILSLYGDRIPYNTCRNIEWQVCAAKGWLQGQQGRDIIFAKAPKTLEPNSGPHPIGSCTGYAPQGCKNGFASSDIVRARPEDVSRDPRAILGRDGERCRDSAYLHMLTYRRACACLCRHSRSSSWRRASTR